MLQVGILVLSIIFVSGCGTTRKISQVGLREPSSVRDRMPFSDLRSSIIQASDIPKSCPKEIKESFASLAGERVEFPPCPEKMAQTFQESLPFLKLEERTTLEELLNSQCRSLGFTEFGDSLENLLHSFDTTGPLGRRGKIVQTLRPVDGEAKVLTDLRGHLQELADYHLPLERWMRRNGDFVLPEEELKQLHRLVFDNKCKISDLDIDYSYRTVRSLEELSKILREEDQEKRIEVFLFGVHQVIEKKLTEFFYP